MSYVIETNKAHLKNYILIFCPFFEMTMRKKVLKSEIQFRADLIKLSISLKVFGPLKLSIRPVLLFTDQDGHSRVD